MQTDIDLNRLRIFREVVLAGSFSKAALNLKLPKSRVSRQIAALEKDVGIQLIHRTTRQFQLTTAGSDLFAHATPLLTQLRAAVDAVRSGSEVLAGNIRLSVPDDLGVSLMGRVCQEFLTLHPKIRIDLHVGNSLVDVIGEGFDLVVRVGKVKDSTMLQRKLGTVGLSFYASPGLLRRFDPISKMEDLLEFPFLAFSSRNLRSVTVKLRKDSRSQSLPLKPIFFTNNFFVLRDMALNDFGVTTLPPFIAKDYIRSGALVPILNGWQTEGGPVQILMPNQKEIPLRIRRFVDFLGEKLIEYLS